MSGQFKSFVSEEEVQEQRKKRQEEWERVRQPDDPIACPEEETRSLFEQLEANKELKDRELEEDSRLRSSVKGLDEDEVQFLDFVSNRQIQIEKDRNKEEKAVIEELKIASVLKVQDKTKDKPASSEADKTSTTQSGSSTSKNSQKQLLLGAIKRKSSDSKSDSDERTKKACLEEDNHNERPDAKLMAGIPKNTGATMVVAGILPGIADYDDSDSSTENDSNSSDSEADHMIMPSIATQRIIQERLMQEMMQRLKEGGCG